MARTLRAFCMAALILSFPVINGCRQSTEKMPATMQVYSVKGVVVSTNPASGEVTLQHEAIPGFMGAMTMPYQLQYANTISELHPGDVIRARLQVQRGNEGDVVSARLDEIAVLAQAKPNFRPESNYNTPTAGQAVSNFHFTNQDGQPIQLDQFRGKAVVVTFIYTRCPLGDFCPRMTRNLHTMETVLDGNPALQNKIQLLSISFDPSFDTPDVLRAYGQANVGKDGFAHWQFAAPDKATLPKVEHFFNVGATTAPDATITHSLSTVLIGPDGKVVAWYPGNQWTVHQVLAAAAVATQPHTTG